MATKAYIFNCKSAKPAVRSCVCMDPKGCREMVTLFREIQDIRGNYSLFPTVLQAEDNRSELAKRQQFRFDRAMRHLEINDPDTVTNVGKTKRAKKNTKKSPAKTRATAREADEPKRQECYIAVWHYPPEVINRFMFDKTKGKLHTNWRKSFLTREFVQNELGGEIKSGYTAVDAYPPDCAPADGSYPIIPTYKRKLAFHDYNEGYKLRFGHTSGKQWNKGKSPEYPPDNCMTPLGVEVEQQRTLRPRSARRQTPLSAIQEDTSTMNSNVDVVVVDTSSSAENTRTSSAKKRKSVQIAGAFMTGVAKRHAQKASAERSRAEVLEAPKTTEKIQYDFVISDRMGPNRVSIQSDRWHAANHRMAKEFFGFETWEQVKDMIYCAFGLEYSEPSISVLKKPTGLNQFEQALIGLMLIESDMSQLKIANIFGYKTHGTISKIAVQWIPEWGRIGRYLSVLPFMNEKTIKAMQSEKLIKLGLGDVAYLIDGKDFPSDTVRVDRVVNCAQQSTKIGKAAIRIISWGLACGLTFDHTDGFLGRSMEKALVKLWASNGRLQIPPGFLGLGDKGFKGTAGYYVNMNAVLYPAFLQTGTQFTQQQSGHSLGCSQGRYSIEVFYSRVTNRSYIAGIITRNQFPYFDDVNHWAHGRANLYRPLQMPAEYKDWFGEA